MSDHALYCIDSPTPAERAEATAVAGWLVASRPILEVEVVAGDGEAGATTPPFVYGAPRPDVERSFGPYPDAARSGFRIALPPGALAGRQAIDLALTLRGPLGMRRRLPLRLHLDSNDVQTVRLHSGKPFRGFDAATLEDRLGASLEARPGITFRLDLINKCNLRCVMCRYSDPEIFSRPVRKLTPAEFRRQFEPIAPLVRNVVLSCADEPLASNHFGEILAYLADEHPHLDVEFCTNAMLMNARIRRLLIEKGVAHLMFSIDGVRAATLERIRVGAKYQRILGNILALRDLKRATGAEAPAFILNYVMMDDNIHEAPAFVELAARLGAVLIDFRHVIPGYFAEPERTLANHPAKYNHFRRRILEEARRHDLDVVLPPAYLTSESFDPATVPEADLAELDAVEPDPDLDAPLPTPRRWPRGFKARHVRGTAADTFAKTFCERPFSEILVADQELVRPCAWYRGHLGKLSESESLADIFFGPEFERLRRDMLRPEGAPGCRGCPLKAEYLMAGNGLAAGGADGSRSRVTGWLRTTSGLLDP